MLRPPPVAFPPRGTQSKWKSAPPVEPADDAGIPPWLVQQYRRHEAFRRAAFAHHGGLPPPPLPSGREAVSEPAGTTVPPAAIAGAGVKYDLAETGEDYENRNLRMAGTVAGNFSPNRHAVVIRGRPVVVSPSIQHCDVAAFKRQSVRQMQQLCLSRPPSTLCMR